MALKKDKNKQLQCNISQYKIIGSSAEYMTN